MSEDNDFVQAILDDWNPALCLVYADWLEERGDPRAEFLRIVEHLRHASDEPHRVLEGRLELLGKDISWIWQALLHPGGPCQPIPHDVPNCHEFDPKFICLNRSCGFWNPRETRQCLRCEYPLPLPSGTVVSRKYRIDEAIALGSFGYVYRAIDFRDKCLVVLKELACADHSDFSYLLPAFRQEADTVKTAQPIPIVARSLEFIEEPLAAYHAVEYLGPRSIVEEQDDDVLSTLSFETVVEVGKQLSALLMLAHGQCPPMLVELELGDCFRTANGMVKVLAGSRRVRWIKYCMRKLHERIRNDPIKMYCGFGMNEPPEQIIGRPEPRSNLFAVAGILYGLLTGESAEGTYTSLVLLDQLSSEDCPIAADQRWLYDLIAKNLAQEPADRCASAREFSDCLERRFVVRPLQRRR